MTGTCATVCAYRDDLNKSFKTEVQLQIWQYAPTGLGSVAVKTACYALCCADATKWASKAQGCGRVGGHDDKPTKAKVEALVQAIGMLCCGFCYHCFRRGSVELASCARHAEE